MIRYQTVTAGFVVCSLLTITGCGWTRDVGMRCYDLADGATIRATMYTFSHGFGQISAIMPDGEQLHGEYSLIPGSNYTIYPPRPVHPHIGTPGTDSLLSMKRDTVGRDMPSWPFEYGFALNTDARPVGTATLRGDKGTVLEIVFFSVDINYPHGDGIARDNKNHHYRVYIGEPD
jgi:hypothetical protein